MSARLLGVGVALLATLAGCDRSANNASSAGAKKSVAAPFTACDASRLTASEKEALRQLGFAGLGAMLCAGQSGIAFDKLYDEGCSMEMGTGSKMNFTALKGQIDDPRKHPDYDFEFRTGWPRAELLLTSRKPGQASFLSDGTDVHCNLAGKAAKQPEQLLGKHNDLSPPKASPGD